MAIVRTFKSVNFQNRHGGCYDGGYKRTKLNDKPILKLYHLVFDLFNIMFNFSDILLCSHIALKNIGHNLNRIYGLTLLLIKKSGLRGLCSLCRGGGGLREHWPTITSRAGEMGGGGCPACYCLPMFFSQSENNIPGVRRDQRGS